jgi:5'(3')-deoxyribonucleotidase
LRIAVDLDGVLAETMEVWCKRANEFLGTSFRLDDLDTWASWRKLGISREQFFQFLDEAWDDWQTIPPTEPRLAGKVRRLEQSGEVDIVTGRSRESVSSAKNWLSAHKIPYNRFVRVPGWKDKIFLNYDIYIDDAPELMPLISRNPKMRGILYTRPWNRNVPEIPRVFRVQNWTEIPKVVEKSVNSRPILIPPQRQSGETVLSQDISECLEKGIHVHKPPIVSFKTLKSGSTAR